MALRPSSLKSRGLEYSCNFYFLSGSCWPDLPTLKVLVGVGDDTVLSPPRTVLSFPFRWRTCLGPTYDQGLPRAPPSSPSIQSYLLCRTCWYQHLWTKVLVLWARPVQTYFPSQHLGQQRRLRWIFAVLYDFQKWDFPFFFTETSNCCWFLKMLSVLDNYKSHIGLFNNLHLSCWWTIIKKVAMLFATRIQ